MADPGCDLCRRLSPDLSAPITYPAPVADDEWRADDRIRGALIGAAIGDALGALHHASKDVEEAKGPGELTTGGATQLGLFTAEGLLRMDIRAQIKGIGPAWTVIQHALQRWAWTQGAKGPFSFASDQSSWPDGWLVRQHLLHRKTPGFGSTLEAIKDGRDVGSELAQTREVLERTNRSDGRGALVRVLSAGLIFRPEQAFLVGAVAGVYTHGGSDGYLGGGVLARIVCGLVAGEDLHVARQAASKDLGSWPHGFRLRKVMLLGAPPATNAARALHQGLVIAQTYDEPIMAIRRSVESAGTAAGIVTGAIVGARSGSSAIPADWRVAPDVVGIIEEIARAASVAHRAWVLGRELPGVTSRTADPFESAPAADLLWPRFPGW